MRSQVVLLVGLFVTGLFAIGDATAQVLTAPLVVDHLQDTPAPRPKSATPSPAAPSATPAAERAPSANPLWMIPLTSLTATGERPVFSPSRRPPVVVVAKAPPPPPPPPPKPAEPEKPQLSLVGTILGENGERIGLFMSPGKALRLKVGEDNKGWVLREVQPRQVVLEKGQQSAVLELPRPDVSKGGPGLSQVSRPSPPGVRRPPDSTPEDMRVE